MIWNKRLHQQKLAAMMFRALNSQLSVEDIIDALGAAVTERLSRAKRMDASPYRAELILFYQQTLRILIAAQREVEAAGYTAKKLTGR